MSHLICTCTTSLALRPWVVSKVNSNSTFVALCQHAQQFHTTPSSPDRPACLLPVDDVPATLPAAALLPHRVDGRGWAHGDLAKFPQIRMVVVQNSLDMTVFDSDAALLQGQAALKGHAGSGSVVAGYKRTLSPLDSLEVNAVLGLRSLLTVTSNRQLGTYTTGSLSATYSYGQGMGMQVRATASCVLLVLYVFWLRPARPINSTIQPSSRFTTRAWFLAHSLRRLVCASCVVYAGAGHHQPSADSRHQCFPDLGHWPITWHSNGVQHEPQRLLVHHHR